MTVAWLILAAVVVGFGLTLSALSYMSRQLDISNRVEGSAADDLREIKDLLTQIEGHTSEPADEIRAKRRDDFRREHGLEGWPTPD